MKLRPCDINFGVTWPCYRSNSRHFTGRDDDIKLQRCFWWNHLVFAAQSFLSWNWWTYIGDLYLLHSFFIYSVCIALSLVYKESIERQKFWGTFCLYQIQRRWTGMCWSWGDLYFLSPMRTILPTFAPLGHHDKNENRIRSWQVELSAKTIAIFEYLMLLSAIACKFFCCIYSHTHACT